MTLWHVSRRAGILCRRQAIRPLYSSPQPLNLAFEKAQPPSPASKDANPVVIIHGLFGQKQNWRSLSRAMAKTLGTDVYAVDLRNHGTSPHHKDMQHATHAADVLHFFETHNLSNVSLIGHSLGGKVASALALSPALPADALSSLTIVDVTPTTFPLSSEFSHYAKSMQAVEHANVKDAKAAQAILADRDIALDIQHFLLTNLGGPIADQGGVRKFRIPLDILASNLQQVGAFPYEPGERTWNGRTLLIKGSKSNYVTDERVEATRAFFPKLELKTLETGHWVHAEKPAEFLELIKTFLRP